MDNKILTFKMWEDAAANSVGAGGIDGIGVGPKGEPGVYLKKKKKKKNERYATGSKGAPDGWEKRSKAQQKIRSDLWKSLGKKLRNK